MRERSEVAIEEENYQAGWCVLACVEFCTALHFKTYFVRVFFVSEKYFPKSA